MHFSAAQNGRKFVEEYHVTGHSDLGEMGRGEYLQCPVQIVGGLTMRFEGHCCDDRRLPIALEVDNPTVGDILVCEQGGFDDVRVDDIFVETNGVAGAVAVEQVAIGVDVADVTVPPLG